MLNPKIGQRVLNRGDICNPEHWGTITKVTPDTMYGNIVEITPDAGSAYEEPYTYNALAIDDEKGSSFSRIVTEEAYHARLATVAISGRRESMASAFPATPEPEREEYDLNRNAVMKRIKTALQKRSGKAWSVTCGRGTACGWLTIDAPPARRTFDRYDTGERDQYNLPVYGWRDIGRAGNYISPDDSAELAKLLGLNSIHCQGCSIASSHDHYREYIDRAEGREPRKIAQPYWD